MSWLYSQALAEDYLPQASLDTARSAQSNGTPMPQVFLSLDKMTALSRPSRYGMTCAPLTDDHGATLLTSFLVAFPAKPIPPQLRVATLQTISGRRCGGSWQMSLPGTYSPRTSVSERSTAQQMTAKRWVTKPDAFPLARKTWVETTFGSGIGYLHTPTCTANYAAPSMQKWPCAQAFTRVFGSPSPTNHEWLMGWPIGWSELSPLATGRFQQWQQQHGAFSQAA